MDETECLDIADKVFRLTDSDALQIIGGISDCRNPSEFQALAATTQKEYLTQLKGAGLSIRQISRLLGVPKGIVERAQDNRTVPCLIVIKGEHFLFWILNSVVLSMYLFKWRE